MTTYFSDDPDGKGPVPEILTETELKTLLTSFVLGSGKQPSIEQAKMVADWATQTRINSTLLDMVLDGELCAYCGDDGEMYFKRADGEKD